MLRCLGYGLWLMTHRIGHQLQLVAILLLLFQLVQRVLHGVVELVLAHLDDKNRDFCINK